jgi:hypothetical protein
MAISNLDGYIGSGKQTFLQKKTASMTAVAQNIFSPFDRAGIPGAGTLAGTNTTTGVVPTDATAGCPTINAFAGGATGYITRLHGYSSVACTLYLVDIVLKMGAFAYNAAATGLTTTSFSTRVPGGTDYTGCRLWLEAVTAFTGNQSIAIGYLDQDGNAGTTGTIATGVAPIVGRCFELPLAAGDTGVRGITSVTSTVSTAGTFNVLIVRPLAMMRIPVAGYSEQRDLYGTGMPQVFDNSALAVYVRPDSTATGLPEWQIEISNG